MKHYYKSIFLLLFLFCSVGFSIAQTDAKKDKIDALRAAFISKKVNLSAKEAQAFWPLYNEMNDKLDAVLKAFKQKYNSQTNFELQSDKEAEEYLNAELYVKQKDYEITKEYYDKFKKVLSVQKVAGVRRAEVDFKKELINSIKGN